MRAWSSKPARCRSRASQLGESIAVNGCCLTVVEFDAQSFAVDASNETLSLTTLGGLGIGAPLNLERAMLPTDRLGGHLVSGHVDGLGMAAKHWDDARAVALAVHGADGAAALHRDEGLDLRGRREPDRERGGRHAASRSR